MSVPNGEQIPIHWEGVLVGHIVGYDPTSGWVVNRPARWRGKWCPVEDSPALPAFMERLRAEGALKLDEASTFALDANGDANLVIEQGRHEPTEVQILRLMEEAKLKL